MRADAFGYIDGAMPPARAAEGERESRFPFGDVQRDEKVEQGLETLQEALRFGLRVEEGGDRSIGSASVAQSRHVVRIRQEPHVEYEVGIQRQAELETERHDVDAERGRVCRVAERRGDRRLEFRVRQRARVPERASARSRTAAVVPLVADRFVQRCRRRERMPAPRLAEAPHQASSFASRKSTSNGKPLSRSSSSAAKGSPKGPCFRISRERASRATPASRASSTSAGASDGGKLSRQ